jgi:lysophospholipase L1-like esterase
MGSGRVEMLLKMDGVHFEQKNYQLLVAWIAELAADVAIFGR